MRASTDLGPLTWLVEVAREAMARRGRRRTRGAFAQVALALDLEADLRGGSACRVFGTLRGYPVELRLSARDALSDATVAEVRLEGGLPPGMTVRLRTDDSPSSVALSADPELDRQLVFQGDPIRWLAVLDAGVRRRISRLLADGLSLQDGILRLTVPERIADPARLQRWLRELPALAEELDLRRKPLGLRVLQGARQAPEAAERIRCLEALVEGVVDEATADRALRAADADPAPEVRLAAARLAGSGGYPRLARLVQDTATPEAIRLAALDTLGTLPPASLHPVLDPVLAGPAGGPVWRRAVQLAARSQHRDARPALAALAAEVTGEDAVALAEALVGLEAGEAALLAALDSDGAAVAAAALGFVGGRAAVGPLRRLAVGRGERARAAREALGRLAARVGDLDGGQLAVADAADGRLAVSPTEDPTD